MGRVEKTNYAERLTPLTRIVGEPTFTTLQLLHKELKRNASSEDSTEGGGNNGFLFLVLPTAEFEAIDDAMPFIRPVHPGTLTIPPGATAAQSTTLRDAHEEAIRVFDEVIGMENALKRQIQQAIAPEFLRQYTNRTTQRLDGTIATIMTNQFRDYGKVTATMFYEEHARVTAYQYNPEQPIDDIWNEIDDLHELSVKAGLTLQRAQMISIAWNILNATGQYGKDLIKWDKKDEADKTWTNFKTFFSTIHRDNKSVNRVTPITESSLNQATETMMTTMTSELAQMKAFLMAQDQTEDSANMQLMNAVMGF